MVDSDLIASDSTTKGGGSRLGAQGEQEGDGMDLSEGKVAVVTGAASGIGLALANRFATAGLKIVLADVEAPALEVAAAGVAAEHGVETHGVLTDVRHAEEVDALAAATIERFGRVDVVCNNAGVSGNGEPWFGPLSTWDWVLGVNLYGVVHGVRAFLPHLLAEGGHIVNTASIAGLLPGFGAPYDASKHAVVALSEDLYTQMQTLGGTVGVSCLCPGWVRTGILDAERNYPAEYGELAPNPVFDILRRHFDRAISEGMTPGAVADLVAGAVEESRFWVFPQQDFLELAIRRWSTIADGLDPQPIDDVPGVPPAAEIEAEVRAALGLE